MPDLVVDPPSATGRQGFRRPWQPTGGPSARRSVAGRRLLEMVALTFAIVVAAEAVSRSVPAIST